MITYDLSNINYYTLITGAIIHYIKIQDNGLVDIDLDTFFDFFFNDKIHDMFFTWLHEHKITQNNTK